MIDLHIHSTVSDGDRTPEDLVIMGKEAGLTAMAISDHDSLEGGRRALIKGQEIGMKVISAVEVSTSIEGQVAHVLVYGAKIEGSEFKKTLENICQYRLDRAKWMISHINEELENSGKPLISVEPLLELGKEKPITRGDIAKYLVDQGCTSSMDEAFKIWLEKYNSPNRGLSVRQLCKIAHLAGGVTVLAHPGSKWLSLNTISENFEDHKRIIQELKEVGLDGLEAYHPDHTLEDIERYIDLAKKLDLIVTGGSDFHSSKKMLATKTTGLGQFEVPDWIIEKLETVIESRGVLV